MRPRWRRLSRRWPRGASAIPGQVNLLPGAHLTPAEVEEVKGLVESFGLTVLAVPDISNALDGHIDERSRPFPPAA